MLESAALVWDQKVSRDILLMKVDEALYRAKAEGRNCVRKVSYTYDKDEQSPSQV